MARSHHFIVCARNQGTKELMMTNESLLNVVQEPKELMMTNESLSDKLEDLGVFHPTGSKRLFEKSLYPTKILSKYEISTVREFYRMLDESQIHPNPVGQRLPTNSAPDCAKNRGIIKSIMNGTGIGLITLRNIKDCTEHEVKRMYKNYNAIVIDGGHRSRAIKLYINNKFAVRIGSKMKKFKDLSDDERETFMESPVALDYKVCTSKQAIEIFRALNSTTKVNAYEMIMADDQSATCKFVRMLSKSYFEYDDNETHDIFEIKYDIDEVPTSRYFSSVNERAIWHTYVFIVLHKAMARANVDAGDKETKMLIDRELNGVFKLTSDIENTVKRFFNDLLAFQRQYKAKITIDIFGAFQCVWFELMSKHNKFNIDMDDFNIAFRKARVKLASSKDRTYQDKTIKNLSGNTVNIKEEFRKSVKSFSVGKAQSWAAKIIIKELGPLKDCGVTPLETKRSYSRKDRQELLDAQSGLCWMCKKSVSVGECELAHDTPHSKGGQVEDGVAMCKECHSNQGLMTLTQFRKMAPSMARWRR